MRAGNTTDTLKSVPVESSVEPSSDDLDVIANELIIKEATKNSLEGIVVHDTDDENTFDVSRAEFKELQEALLRLVHRVAKFNEGAPHKI